jgi:hypothetical protein
MAQAAGRGASLLARDDDDPDLSVKSAQLTEGPFMARLLQESATNGMTTVLTIHVPSTPGRGAGRRQYYRPLQPMLHLYDAFSALANRRFAPPQLL